MKYSIERTKTVWR